MRKSRKTEPQPLGYLFSGEREELQREARFCTLADQAWACDVPLKVFAQAARGEGVPVEVIEKIRRTYAAYGPPPLNPGDLLWWQTGGGGYPRR